MSQGASWALVIETDPPLGFYTWERPAGVDLAWPRLTQIGPIESVLRLPESGGSANSNGSATIDGGDGELHGYLNDPPLGAPVRVLRSNAEVWRGRVTRIRLGAQIQIDLEG